MCDDVGGAHTWFTTNGYDANRVTGRVVAGDFNNDGKDDIASLYDYGQNANGSYITTVHVWLSTGTGFLYQTGNGWWSSHGYTANRVTGRVAAGDFNGDGKCDIATMYDDGPSSTTIHIWLSTGSSFAYQTGNGWWSTGPGWGLGGYNANNVTDRVVAGKFNTDNKYYIAAIYDYGTGIYEETHVWLSTGSNPFSYYWW